MVKLTKKHSKIYNAFQKQWTLTSSEFKRLFGHPLKLVFLLLLFFVFIGLGQYILKQGASLPTIILADEDRSVEVRTFIENVAYNKLKDVANFEEMSFEEGTKKLENGGAIGLIHIPEGTRDSLDTLEESQMFLYVKDKDNLHTKFFMAYMQDMVDLLNKGQSGAMVYWYEMRNQGVEYNERLDALNDMSIEYALAFLTRSDVFATNRVEDPLEGLLPVQYYGYSLIWVLVIISGIFVQTSIVTDRRKGIERRLLLSGYSLEDYLVARIQTGTIFSLLWLILLVLIFKFLLGISLIGLDFKILLIIIWVVALINGFIVWLMMYGQNKIVLITGLLIALLGFLSSGLMLPEFYMLAPLKSLSYINIINYGDNVLKGYDILSIRTLMQVVNSFGLYLMFSYTKKRGAQ